MKDTGIEQKIQQAREQINWTAGRIDDSQEHAQIARLEARLEREQKHFSDLLREKKAMTTHTFTTEELAARDAAISAKALQMAASKCKAMADQIRLGTLLAGVQSPVAVALRETQSEMYEAAEAAILALQPAPSRWQEVPEGSVVVPVEPDMLVYETSKDVIKMFNDGDEHQQMLYELMFSKAWRAVCRAMIGSAP